MASEEAASSSYVTCMELVRRLTFTSATPSSLHTAFSTWAEQAEQVMPVTLNFCFIGLHLAFSAVWS